MKTIVIFLINNGWRTPSRNFSRIHDYNDKEYLISYVIRLYYAQYSAINRLIMQLTISECIQKYLSSVKLSRSANTFRTYTNAMNLFTAVLQDNGIEVETADVTSLPEDAVIWILAALKEAGALG